jgi:hypothetical protein
MGSLPSQPSAASRMNSPIPAVVSVSSSANDVLGFLRSHL